MSRTEDLKKTTADIRTALLASRSQARERAHIGRVNESKAAELDKSLADTIEVRDALRETINYIVQEYKNIEQYAKNRKEVALDMLKTAIEKAGYIVPDAKVAGITLDVKDRKARIVDARGTDINKREGSAYRTVLGMLIGYTLLKIQPDAIQAMFLDEKFNTLSDETIATMREYIDVFKEDTLIVGIEQRDALFQGIERTEFRAIKENGKTLIIKEG